MLFSGKSKWEFALVLPHVVSILFVSQRCVEIAPPHIAGSRGTFRISHEEIPDSFSCEFEGAENSLRSGCSTPFRRPLVRNLGLWTVSRLVRFNGTWSLSTWMRISWWNVHFSCPTSRIFFPRSFTSVYIYVFSVRVIDSNKINDFRGQIWLFWIFFGEIDLLGNQSY